MGAQEPVNIQVESDQSLGRKLQLSDSLYTLSLRVLILVIIGLIILAFCFGLGVMIWRNRVRLIEPWQLSDLLRSEVWMDRPKIEGATEADRIIFEKAQATSSQCVFYHIAILRIYKLRVEERRMQRELREAAQADLEDFREENGTEHEMDLSNRARNSPDSTFTCFSFI